jgi:hypothetical protein
MLVASRTIRAHELYDSCESRNHRMNVMAGSRPPPIRSAMDIEKALVRSIEKRTGGRVRSLQTHILGGRVVLRGVANSYHVVQLAIAGLFEAFHAMNLDKPEDVELDMDVWPDGSVFGSDLTPVLASCEENS